MKKRVAPPARKPRRGVAHGRPRSRSGSIPEKEVVLPYLRFNRDKHGYENTFVVESDRRRGRSRTRVLYWFRTPPGVKVGRAALDEDAIRLIEQLNPGIEFDWTRILKGQGTPATEPDRRPKPDGSGPTTGARNRTTPAPATAVPAARSRADRPRRRVRRGRGATGRPRAEPVVASEPSREPPRPKSCAIADEIADARARRIGTEGVQRLRARYAEILVRISERADDDAPDRAETASRPSKP